jgi:Mn2+/Fe2+ NRAMP family transporter
MMTEFCGVGHSEEKIFSAGELLNGPLAATIFSMNIWYAGIMSGVRGIGQGKRFFLKGEGLIRV